MTDTELLDHLEEAHLELWNSGNRQMYDVQIGRFAFTMNKRPWSSGVAYISVRDTIEARIREVILEQTKHVSDALVPPRV